MKQQKKSSSILWSTILLSIGILAMIISSALEKNVGDYFLAFGFALVVIGGVDRFLLVPVLKIINDN